ncbi:hypothetical protein KCP76_24995 [Salmonella enterica subsp. enterica serovar Weltevreden]|nr:hypothetical protein KCP76_24995 [Salmonella enterica subsp. enterica serovar Weltevreden]
MESEIDSRLVSHQDANAGQPWPFRKLRSFARATLLVQAVNHWHEPVCRLLMRPFRASCRTGVSTI